MSQATTHLELHRVGKDSTHKGSHAYGTPVFSVHEAFWMIMGERE